MEVRMKNQRKPMLKKVTLQRLTVPEEVGGANLVSGLVCYPGTVGVTQIPIFC